MRLIKVIFYVLLLLLGVSFAALNSTSISINLYVKTLTLPIPVLVVLTFGFGLLLGSFLCLLKYWRLRGEFLKIKNQLKLTEQEIKNLRDIPLKDKH